MTPEIIARVNVWLVGREHDALVAAWVTQADLWSLLGENGADQRGATAALSGILLALVREAWGDPMMAVSQAWGWDGSLEYTDEWEIEGRDRRIPEGSYKTEAEALIVALEAAPRVPL
jgi:hypothetical protein